MLDAGNLLTRVEQALEEKNLEQAQRLIGTLKPFVVGNNVEQLIALQDRIRKITFTAKDLRAASANSLSEIRNQRNRAVRYTMMQDSLDNTS